MVNPELIALREKVETHDKTLSTQSTEIAELRGNLHQLDKVVAATVRQSVWQLIVLIATLCAAIIGGLTYQTHVIDKRLEQIEKRFDQRADAIEKQIEQSEKNINARFEDLKQEVRARQK